MQAPCLSVQGWGIQKKRGVEGRGAAQSPALPLLPHFLLYQVSLEGGAGPVMCTS